jgi:putative ABC transport system permease protein
MSVRLSAWVLAWRLARRELRGGIKGFRIFIACLALGVAAIAAVQSISQGVQEGLRADGRALLGGDLAIRQLYRAFDADQQSYLAAAGRVGYSAEVRAMARPDDGSDRSALVELKAVDGAYPLFGEVKLAGGGGLAAALVYRDTAWGAGREGAWGAVAEQATLDRLGLAVGDAVTVGETRFVLRDVISREPDRVGSGGFSLGPRLMIGLAALPTTGLLQPGAMVYWNAKLALNPDIDAGDWRRQTEARYGDDGWRVRDFTNASPQLARFIDRLSQFMTLVGLTALLVGGVGVSNAVRAHLDSRMTVIAVMKCLGAPAGLVTRMFLLQILALAAVGIGVGLVLGALTPLAAQGLLADLLPIQARFGVRADALLPAAAFGALTALTFSLWPLGRAGAAPAAALFRDRIAPVNSRPATGFIIATAISGVALATLAVFSADNKLFSLWFVAGSAVAFGLFRLAAWGVEKLAAKAPKPKNPAFRLALANLHRPGNSVAAVAASLGLGLTVLAAISLVEGNFARRVGEATPAGAPSFFFIDIQSAQYPAFKATVEAFPGVTKIEAAASLRGRIVAVNGKPAEEAVVDRSADWVLRGDRGVSYAATRPGDAPMISGEWWPADYKGPPLLSISEDVAKTFAIGPGARIGVNVLGRTIEGQVANVRRIDFGTMSLNFILVFSPGVLEAAPHTWAAAVYADAAAESGLQKAVLAGWPNVSAIRLKEALETAAGILKDVGVAVRGVAAVALLAGALVLAGALAAGARRRIYDAVVLKVLGASRRQVASAYLLEYGLLGLAAAGLSVALGTLVAWAVTTQVMGFEWTFLPGAALSVTLAALVLTLGLGLAGAWRALGAPAAPLLRNE